MLSFHVDQICEVIAGSPAHVTSSEFIADGKRLTMNRRKDIRRNETGASTVPKQYIWLPMVRRKIYCYQQAAFLKSRCNYLRFARKSILSSRFKLCDVYWYGVNESRPAEFEVTMDGSPVYTLLLRTPFDWWLEIRTVESSCYIGSVTRVAHSLFDPSPLYLWLLVFTSYGSDF